jgi:predicted nucleotidyltransferase
MSTHLERIGAQRPRDPTGLPESFWRQEPALVAVYVFGSMATGRSGPEPDLDVALLVTGRPLAKPRRDDIAATWRARLVDALGSERIDVVVVDGAPLVLCHRVLRDGRLLFCSNTRVRIQFEVDVIRRYCDSRWMRDLFREALKRELLAHAGAANRG